MRGLRRLAVSARLLRSDSGSAGPSTRASYSPSRSNREALAALEMVATVNPAWESATLRLTRCSSKKPTERILPGTAVVSLYSLKSVRGRVVQGGSAAKFSEQHADG